MRAGGQPGPAQREPLAPGAGWHVGAETRGRGGGTGQEGKEAGGERRKP